MKTVTHKTKAWLTDYSTKSPKELFEGNLTGVTYSNYDMTSSGWTFIGDAEVALQIVEEKTLVENKVEALRAEAANIRAEATAKCTKIEGQIQQLLAIDFQPSPS